MFSVTVSMTWRGGTDFILCDLRSEPRTVCFVCIRLVDNSEQQQPTAALLLRRKKKKKKQVWQLPNGE
jgi:invasion protein IalB